MDRIIHEHLLLLTISDLRMIHGSWWGARKVSSRNGQSSRNGHLHFSTPAGSSLSNVHRVQPFQIFAPLTSSSGSGHVRILCEVVMSSLRTQLCTVYYLVSWIKTRVWSSLYPEITWSYPSPNLPGLYVRTPKHHHFCTGEVLVSIVRPRDCIMRGWHLWQCCVRIQGIRTPKIWKPFCLGTPVMHE